MRTRRLRPEVTAQKSTAYVDKLKAMTADEWATLFNDEGLETVYNQVELLSERQRGYLLVKLSRESYKGLALCIVDKFYPV